MSDIGSTQNSRIQPRPESGGAIVSRPGGGRSRRLGDGSRGAGPDIDHASIIETAFQRLRTLLAFDGDKGPRDGVQRRGFYLNIQV